MLEDSGAFFVNFYSVRKEYSKVFHCSFNLINKKIFFSEDKKLTPEILKDFADLERLIQKMERKQPEERLMLLKFELKSTEESVKAKNNALEAAKAVA